MYLDRLFKLMAEKQASDLFISCGAPINLKVNGVVQPVSTQPMDIETVRRIAYELMNKEQAREFENTMEMNLSHLDRARRQLPRQHLPPARHDLAGHPLRAQQRAAVRAAEAAVGAARPRHREARPRAGRRRDRLRQVDHARRDDRLPQLDQARPHPHHRGPDRVPVRAQAEHHQPARDRRRHARPTATRCRTRCARRPTSS